MFVDSILNGASLRKLYNRYPKVVGELKARDNMTIMNALAWCCAWGISIDHENDKKSNKPFFSMEQTSFFKFVDLIALIRLRTYLLYEYLDDGNGLHLYIDGETFFDPYDVQPFRENLFNTRRSVLEFNIICADLGIDDDNCKINNFTNKIEFYEHFDALLSMVGHWIEEFNTLLYEYMMNECYANMVTEAKMESKIWTKDVLDSTWKHRRSQLTSRGEKVTMYPSCP